MLTSKEEEAWEATKRRQAAVEKELLDCRRLLYQVSKHPYGLSLLSKAKTFLALLTQYKGDRTCRDALSGTGERVA